MFIYLRHMILWSIVTLALPSFANASLKSAEHTAVGIGGVAMNLMEPVQVAAGFISSISLIIGGTCLFAAFIRYMQYRVNHLAHPISVVITLLIVGILLLCLPLIYKLTESGIPYSLA